MGKYKGGRGGSTGCGNYPPRLTLHERGTDRACQTRYGPNLHQAVIETPSLRDTHPHESNEVAQSSKIAGSSEMGDWIREGAPSASHSPPVVLVPSGHDERPRDTPRTSTCRENHEGWGISLHAWSVW